MFFVMLMRDSMESCSHIIVILLLMSLKHDFTLLYFNVSYISAIFTAYALFFDGYFFNFDFPGNIALSDFSNVNE